MKRRAFDRWLAAYGCELDREGSRHSWFINRALKRRSAVPRHAEIRDELVRKICRDLGIDVSPHCCEACNHEAGFHVDQRRRHVLRDSGVLRWIAAGEGDGQEHRAVGA